MATFIIHPTAKEESKALKAFLNTLRIPYEETKTPYHPEFVAKINEGKKIFYQEKQKAFPWMNYENRICWIIPL